VVYEVLKWEPDPSRSVARVKAALRAYAPEVFVPPDPEAHERLREVTLFMNDDGTISRLFNMRCDDKGCKACNLDKACKDPPFEADPFAAMGISPERLGRRGTWLAAGEFWVTYAWPRRPDDLPPRIDMRAYEYPRYDSDDDERIGERYFHKVHTPDVETEYCAPHWHNAFQGCSQTLPMPWALLGRDGHVWDAGFGPGGATFEYVESIYPGIRVDKGEGQWFGFGGANGFSIWIAPDSPIQRKSDVDMEKRRAFLVTGMSTSTNNPEPTTRSWPNPAWFVAAADLGVPVEMRNGTWRSMPEDGSGVEVTVTQADQAKITMNVRTQPKLGVHAGSWTQTARLEAPYGQTTTIELPGETLNQRLLLRVERLKQ
jgi:hypothetical protein